MRAAFLVFAFACSSNPTSPTTSPVAEPPVVEPPAHGSAQTFPAARYPDDRDGDGVVDKCDLCPDSKEIFNSTDDLDGCVDSVADQVADHPSNRYAQPIVQFDYPVASTTPSTPFVTWEIPEDVEALACIGVSREDGAVAAARAKLLCNHLRSYLPRQRPKLEIVELAVNAHPTYRRDNGAWFGANGELRVLRAAGVELWRRDGDQLVEAMPRKTKNPRPITPECRATPPREEFHRNRP